MRSSHAMRLLTILEGHRMRNIILGKVIRVWPRIIRILMTLVSCQMTISIMNDSPYWCSSLWCWIASTVWILFRILYLCGFIFFFRLIRILPFLILLINDLSRIIDIVSIGTFSQQIFRTSLARLIKIQLLLFWIISHPISRFILNAIFYFGLFIFCSVICFLINTIILWSFHWIFIFTRYFLPLSWIHRWLFRNRCLGITSLRTLLLNSCFFRIFLFLILIKFCSPQTARNLSLGFDVMDFYFLIKFNSVLNRNDFSQRNYHCFGKRFFSYKTII